MSKDSQSIEAVLRSLPYLDHVFSEDFLDDWFARAVMAAGSTSKPSLIRAVVSKMEKRLGEVFLSLDSDEASFDEVQSAFSRYFFPESTLQHVIHERLFSSEKRFVDPEAAIVDVARLAWRHDRLNHDNPLSDEKLKLALTRRVIPSVVPPDDGQDYDDFKSAVLHGPRHPQRSLTRAFMSSIRGVGSLATSPASRTLSLGSLRCQSKPLDLQKESYEDIFLPGPDETHRQKPVLSKDTTAASQFDSEVDETLQVEPQWTVPSVTVLESPVTQSREPTDSVRLSPIVSEVVHWLPSSGTPPRKTRRWWWSAADSSESSKQPRQPRKGWW